MYRKYGVKNWSLKPKPQSVVRQSFWGRRQSQQYFSNVFHYYYTRIPSTCFGPYGQSSSGIYTIYIYWLIPKKLFLLQRIRCSCLGYQLYIFVFCFGDFFAAVCMYVVDMITYYCCYIFQYYVITLILFTLKLINGNVLNS
jgi:hypothetical protein